MRPQPAPTGLGPHCCYYILVGQGGKRETPVWPTWTRLALALPRLVRAADEPGDHGHGARLPAGQPLHDRVIVGAPVPGSVP